MQYGFSSVGSHLEHNPYAVGSAIGRYSVEIAIVGLDQMCFGICALRTSRKKGVKDCHLARRSHFKYDAI